MFDVSQYVFAHFASLLLINNFPSFWEMALALYMLNLFFIIGHFIYIFKSFLCSAILNTEIFIESPIITGFCLWYNNYTRYS